MKKLVRSHLIPLSILCLLITDGCDPPKIIRLESEQQRLEGERKAVEKEIGYGKLDGRTYTNEYFNLKVQVPYDWHIVSKAESEHSKEYYRKKFNLKDNEKSFQRAQACALKLLLISKQKLGTQALGTFIENLHIDTDKIADRKSLIRHARDYLSRQIMTMKAQNVNVVCHSIQDGFKIGNLAASRLNADIMWTKDKKSSTVMYCSLFGDYALLITLNHVSPEGLKELEAIFNTIEASY